MTPWSVPAAVVFVTGLMTDLFGRRGKDLHGLEPRTESLKVSVLRGTCIGEKGRIW